eukprot:28374-Chlamydomonas_euryale.AAC.1
MCIKGCLCACGVASLSTAAISRRPVVPSLSLCLNLNLVQVGSTWFNQIWPRGQTQTQGRHAPRRLRAHSRAEQAPTQSRQKHASVQS